MSQGQSQCQCQLLSLGLRPCQLLSLGLRPCQLPPELWNEILLYVDEEYRAEICLSIPALNVLNLDTWRSMVDNMLIQSIVKYQNDPRVTGNIKEIFDNADIDRYFLIIGKEDVFGNILAEPIIKHKYENVLENLYNLLQSPFNDTPLFIIDIDNYTLQNRYESRECLRIKSFQEFGDLLKQTLIYPDWHESHQKFGELFRFHVQYSKLYDKGGLEELNKIMGWTDYKNSNGKELVILLMHRLSTITAEPGTQSFLLAALYPSRFVHTASEEN